MPEPLRLAFLGQRVYFEYTTLEEPAAGVEPTFVDFPPEARADEIEATLAAFEPDVVVCFRPEFVPAGALHDIGAVTVGYLTEPLPRPGRPTHADLETRLGYLRAADPGNFDRIVSYDPYIAATVDPILPVWRSLPIPVSDRLFGPVTPATGPPRILFTGRSTAHRDAFLGPVKHHFAVVHLAHGVTDVQLEAFMAASDIGLNLHNEPYPNYENRVSVYAARGLLVISEELSPRWGLEPGIDYVEVRDPWDLFETVRAASVTPDAFRSMRQSARRKAERFRASRVWPALAREALADVAAFGSPRESQRRRASARGGRAGAPAPHSLP